MPAWAVALLLSTTGAASAGGAPSVLSVEPSREGGLLLCHVATAGLPGPRIAASLRSGLVSAIDVDLELLDARDHVLAGNRVTLRLAFDLWEEIFAVEGAGEPRRFPDLAALEAFLADLRALPVAPLPPADGRGRLRVRAGVVLHPVAPSEIARVGEIIGGPPAGDDRAGGGQQITIGLGRLIRLFYRRDDGDRDGAAALSDWFAISELRDDAP